MQFYKNSDVFQGGENLRFCLPNYRKVKLVPSVLWIMLSRSQAVSCNS